MITLKPIRPVVRDEKTYQRKLVSFLKVTIQGPLARAVINSTSVADILRFNDQLANEVLNIDDLGFTLANEEFAGVAQRHTTKFARSMAGVIPEIGLKLSQQTVSAWLNEKTATNVRLIRGMNENQFVKFNEKLNRLLGATEFDRQAVAQAAKDAFDVGDSRANLIGRDQISKATGELNLIRQKEVGISKYRWQTSEDERVRPTHAANNDKIFSWGEPPADTGHPGHDINCFTGDTLINDFGVVGKLFRRFYSGELTEFISDDGAIFKCTPNHEFLTDKGWKAAKFLNVGDNIIHVRNQTFDGFKADKDNSIFFDDLFRSASLLFGVETTKGLSGQFHGDGIENEKVEIVNIKSELRDKLEPLVFEMLCDYVFAIAKMCHSQLPGCGLSFLDLVRFNGITSSNSSTFAEFMTFFGTKLSHAIEHSCGTSTSLNAASLQKIGNCFSLNTKQFGKLFDALAFTVKLDNHILVEILRVMWFAMMPNNFPACHTDRVAEIVGVDAEVSCDFTKVHAPLHHGVSTINKVSRKYFSGHVYNLENENNWYTIAENLIAHNCRCVAIPVIDD